jgi:addiction module HigA family antidote
LHRTALRKLVQVDAAESLEDPRGPRENRLEVLRGRRSGQLSIRITRQWRICFAWRDGVPPGRINEIVHGKRGISAHTALRLARFLATSERLWLNLRSRYNLAAEKDRSQSTEEALVRQRVTDGRVGVAHAITADTICDAAEEDPNTVDGQIEYEVIGDSRVAAPMHLGGNGRRRP